MERNKTIENFLTEANGLTKAEVDIVSAKLGRLIARGEKTKLNGEWIPIDVMSETLQRLIDWNAKR